ncbi:MAG: URC4/urg3 family protein [Alphaproteobacteria bacterium]
MEGSAALAYLRSAAAVRERAHRLLSAAERDELAHFAVDGTRMAPLADYVIDTIRIRYPTLAVPYHSRWRHFEAGGIDRWEALRARLKDADEIARVRFDLVIPSVLLDAGAGSSWSFRDADGGVHARSEGLGVATFRMFVDGLFSADSKNPLRADAARLEALGDLELAQGFQAGPDNLLTGLPGRADLMRRLGAAARGRPELFPGGRIGGLFDAIKARAKGRAIAAPAILELALDALGPIWPGRIELDGVNLGDVWRHRAMRTGDATDGLVPFHKLSQWLTYSLVEPLEEAGVAVNDLDGLTGLAEYRNGGLFIDGGVLRFKDAKAAARSHTVESELVVEWRALTVALLDRVADAIRSKLGLDAGSLPLAKVLEGGTWAAGRRLAAEKRAGGAPPIRIASDGTVF